MSRLDGKTAVITGGTSGMGAATAKLIIERGGRVLVTGRSHASVDQARLNLGTSALAVKSAMDSTVELDALRELIAKHFGEIDFLFLNAGVTRAAPVGAMTEADYDLVMAVNTKGSYFTLQRLAPLIKRGGAVVITTSVANVKGLPMSSVYAASKAALRSMTRSFARELLPQGIRVNAVSPGPIDTSILEKSMSAEAAAAAKKHFRDSNPMQRLGQADEIARAALFLAFEATFTTGAELPVDGGASQL